MKIISKVNYHLLTVTLNLLYHKYGIIIELWYHICATETCPLTWASSSLSISWLQRELSWWNGSCCVSWPSSGEKQRRAVPCFVMSAENITSAKNVSQSICECYMCPDVQMSVSHVWHLHCYNQLALEFAADLWFKYYFYHKSCHVRFYKVVVPVFISAHFWDLIIAVER